MKIEGKNAVQEAITGGTKIDKLWVENSVRGAEAQELIDGVKKSGGRVEFFSKTQMDTVSKTKRHQGWIAETAEFEYLSLDGLLAATNQKGGDALFLLLDGIADPHNLGACIRVAECAGVDGIILPERRAAGVNETVVRVAAGATAHIRLARVSNLNDAIRRLKKDGIRVLGAELGGENLFKANLCGSLALVIGSEGEGLHRLTKELCDDLVTIPQFGQVNSLNASVACGVVLFHAVYQRTGGR